MYHPLRSFLYRVCPPQALKKMSEEDRRAYLEEKTRKEDEERLANQTLSAAELKATRKSMTTKVRGVDRKTRGGWPIIFEVWRTYRPPGSR